MNDMKKCTLDNGFTCVNLSEMEAKEHVNRTISCGRCGLSVDIAEDGSTIYSNFVVSESGKIQRKEYNVGLATASRFCAALEYAFSDVSVNAETVVELDTVVNALNKLLPCESKLIQSDGEGQTTTVSLNPSEPAPSETIETCMGYYHSKCTQNHGT